MENVSTALARKEAELTQGLADLTGEQPDTAAIGFGKRVGEGTTIAVQRMNDVAAQERMLEMLDLVHRAQAKLKDGSYGLCAICGAEIGDGRLEARPWAVTCIQHADTPLPPL